MIMAVLYRDDGKDEAEIKIIDVLVCKMRAELRPFGVEIETVRGAGYRLGRRDVRGDCAYGRRSVA